MDMNREKLLKELMAADFFCYDLALYLDTHPNDYRALMMYNAHVQHAEMVRMNYERQYGPITARTAGTCGKWRWIESPWPWQKGG